MTRKSKATSTKKFVRRDGFKGISLFICSPHPIIINPTEKDSRKRLIQQKHFKKKK